MMKRFQTWVGLVLSTAIANSLVVGSALADHCDCDLFELEYESGELSEPRSEAEYFYGYEPDYHYQSTEWVESQDESIDATELLEDDASVDQTSGWGNEVTDESISQSQSDQTNSTFTSQTSNAWGETPERRDNGITGPENVMVIFIALGLWFGLPALFSTPKAK